ncbi:RnfABCDGE type electron transport complex subunit B [bacterium]|nr:RnfABCDGE type electron transport complex subunit B [bacterium]MCP5462153.1 RnfABCDGE type electron transport complex subunit B [bacterium]
MSNFLILASIIILGILGLLFGVCLAFASRIFSVKKDPRFDEVYSALPEYNCGACGYPGCKPYAEAILKGEKTTLCKPGGKETAARLSEVMGVKDQGDIIEEVAYVFCSGGPGAKKITNYTGIPTCNAAALLGGGPLKCDYGCMMFYDCLKVCDYDAIRIREDGLPEVIPDKCTACMACVEACPKNIIKMVPKKQETVYVACNNPDYAKEVMDVCSNGCISCEKCVRACPVGAISMVDGLAVIDQNKCELCLDCVPVCPTHVIKHLKGKVVVDTNKVIKPSNGGVAASSDCSSEKPVVNNALKTGSSDTSASGGCGSCSCHK